MIDGSLLLQLDMSHTVAILFGYLDLTNLLSPFSDLIHAHNWIEIAQVQGQFSQDVVGDMAKGWNNFIRSGQWAALLIGLFVGYMFRVFTSSG
jgi:hypothetical protein